MDPCPHPFGCCGHVLDHRSQSYGLRPLIEGFSHGLRKCPPDTFLPSLCSGRPFKSAPTNKKQTPSEWMGFVFWRRRRDLNPRNPFGVYTISNRARSASYATSPYRYFVCQPQPTGIYYNMVRYLSIVIFRNLKNILSGKTEASTLPNTIPGRFSASVHSPPDCARKLRDFPTG